MQEINRSPATTSRSNDPANRPSSRCAHDTSLSVVSSATGVTGPSGVVDLGLVLEGDRPGPVVDLDR